MGKVIAFWSPCSQVGKTTIMHGVLKRVEQLLKNKAKILVIDISQGNKSIVKFFELQKYGLCMEDIINLKINAEFSLKMDDLLARTGNMYFLRRRNFFRNMPFGHSQMLDEFVDELKDSFDVIMFDTTVGNVDSFTNSIINSCDCLVNVFGGNDDFSETDVEINENTINIINFSKFDLCCDKQALLLKRKYKDSYVFPYYKELKNISANVNISSIMHYHPLFNKNIDNIARSLLDIVDIDIANNDEVVVNKSLIMRLLTQ